MQRGLVRWFLSLHSPKHQYAISPKKLVPRDKIPDEVESQETIVDGAMRVDESDEAASLPPRAVTPDAARFPPAPLPMTPVKTKSGSGIKESPGSEVPMPPPAFTPSINRTLNRVMPARYTKPSLPEGLTIKDLQSRLEGKKKTK